MVYIDIDGIDNSNHRNSDKKSQFRAHGLENSFKSKSFYKFILAFCFLGSLSFGAIYYLGSHGIDNLVSVQDNDEFIKKVSFKKLANIEPAAGEDLDALLDWDNKTDAELKSVPDTKSEVKAINSPIKTNVVKRDNIVVKKQENAPTSNVNQQDIKDLKESIEGLSKRVDLYKSQSVDSKTIEEASRSISNNIGLLLQRMAKIESQVESLSTRIDILEKKSAEVEVKKNQTTKTDKSSSNSSKKEGVSKSGWVLKSAREGMAWVSPRGKDDLKVVEVGDILEGLGKISDINKNEKGKWFIKGDKGVVGQ